MSRPTEEMLTRILITEGKVELVDYVLATGKALDPGRCWGNFRPTVSGIRKLLSRAGVSIPHRTYRCPKLSKDTKIDIAEAARLGIVGLKRMRTPTLGDTRMRRVEALLERGMTLDPKSTQINTLRHEVLLHNRTHDPSVFLAVADRTKCRLHWIESRLTILRNFAKSRAWNKWHDQIRERLCKYEDEAAHLSELMSRSEPLLRQLKDGHEAWLESSDLMNLISIARRSPDDLRQSLENAIPRMPGFHRLCAMLVGHAKRRAYDASLSPPVEDVRRMATRMLFSYLMNELPLDRVRTAALGAYVRESCGRKFFYTCVAEATNQDVELVELVFRKWSHDAKAPKDSRGNKTVSPEIDEENVRKHLSLEDKAHDERYAQVLDVERALREHVRKSGRNSGLVDPDPSSFQPTLITSPDHLADDPTYPGDSSVDELLDRTSPDLIKLFRRWCSIVEDCKKRNRSMAPEQVRGLLRCSITRWRELMAFVREFNWLTRGDDVDPETLTQIEPKPDHKR